MNPSVPTSVRMSVKERELVEKAASHAQVTLSNFLRKAAVAHAEDILAGNSHGGSDTQGHSVAQSAGRLGFMTGSHSKSVVPENIKDFVRDEINAMFGAS